MENFSNIDGIEISYRSYGGAGKNIRFEIMVNTIY